VAISKSSSYFVAIQQSTRPILAERIIHGFYIRTRGSM
jgi:hypothetical protein